MTRRETKDTSSKSSDRRRKTADRIRLQRTPPRNRTRPPCVLYGVNVKHTVVVAQGGEDALAALAALSAQCSKVGNNLNQLVRHFNLAAKDTEQLRAHSGGTVRTHELSAESRRNGW